jgi:hypothetical protein
MLFLALGLTKSKLSQPSMPNNHALRQIIKRVRKKDIPIQPTYIDNINVPLPLRTINGQIFLVKYASFYNKQILLFTTKSNVENLRKSSYWIMDGTFKTVPTLFR